MKYSNTNLSSICELQPGFAFKSKDFGDYPSKVIKIANITPPTVEMNCLTGVNLDNYDLKKLEKYKVKDGDYVLAMTGATIGKIGRINSGEAYINQRVLAFKTLQIADKDFVYYSLLQPSFYKFILNNVDSETAQANISHGSIGRYQIAMPKLSEQQKIGKFLYALDRKIQINNSINDNLADLLQTVYQSQFGNVGSAAEQGILSDICSYSRDRVAVSMLEVSTYYSTENMLPAKAGATEATSLPTIAQTTVCHKGDTLISNIRPYFKKIVYCEDECGCSNDVLCFTPVQPQYAAFLFSTLYADKFFAFMVAGSKGTKMPRGDKRQIMTFPVALPSDEKLEEFNALALPILAQIHSNRCENKRLSAVRDVLLPKLMAGEIDVAEVDI